MRDTKLAALSAVILSLGNAAFGADAESIPPPEPVPQVIEIYEQPVYQESQWDRFKAGAREAGSAVAQGTRNTAGKVAEGSKKAGGAIAEGYEEVKEFVKEKLD